MRKLQLDPEELRVESFATTDAEFARRGTVHAQDAAPSDAGMLSCGGGGCSGASVCMCDTTYTQRAPECDPSEQTLCVGDTLCG